MITNEKNVSRAFVDYISGLAPANITKDQAKVLDYVRGIINGTVVANVERIQACNRFVKDLENMNIGRAIEIEQAAYDRFIAR